MAWKAVVPPRLGTQDGAGWCLRFAQSFFGAPVRHNSAWDAWLATQGKYSPSEPLPDVPVLLWFEHWGTYGSPPTYGNWGHVAILVPGDAIYTSPASGYGQGRYATISQIEQTFNCRYVGWSTDINGLLVADYIKDEIKPEQPEPAPIQGDDEMTKPMLAMKLDGKELNGLGVMIEPDGAVIGLKPDEWDMWKGPFDIKPVEVRNPGHWERLMLRMEQRRKRFGVTVTKADVEAITKSVQATIPKATATEVAKILKVAE